jgi:hypothetical protein
VIGDEDVEKNLGMVTKALPMILRTAGFGDAEREAIVDGCLWAFGELGKSRKEQRQLLHVVSVLAAKAGVDVKTELARVS